MPLFTHFCQYSYESGILEDPNTHAPKELYLMTSDPEVAPDTPTVLDIEFKNGIDVLIG